MKVHPGALTLLNVGVFFFFSCSFLCSGKASALQELVDEVVDLEYDVEQKLNEIQHEEEVPVATQIELGESENRSGAIIGIIIGIAFSYLILIGTTLRFAIVKDSEDEIELDFKKVERKCKKKASIASETSLLGDSAPSIKITVASEFWRFVTYLSFWSMCIFAIIVSKSLVTPYLAAGPDDGSTCAPFERTVDHLGGKPLVAGEGFDFATQNHLIQLFGFANICANWDYSPARELTAMVYPIFEYNLMIYVIFDYLSVWLAHKRGELEGWFWKYCNVIFPVCLFLCSQFRMIFVCLAYVDVRDHTIGFLGLQIALILITITNALYVWDSHIAYKFLGGLKGTRIAAITFVILNLIISCFKITATIYIVRNGVGAPFTLEPVGSVVVGQLIDWIWMVFNAILPLIISFLRMRNESPLKITISQDVFYVEDNMKDNTSDAFNAEE